MDQASIETKHHRGQLRSTNKLTTTIVHGDEGLPSAANIQPHNEKVVAALQKHAGGDDDLRAECA